MPGTGSRDYWLAERDACAAAEIELRLGSVGPDPWAREVGKESLARLALGIGPCGAVAGERRHAVVPDEPRARVWARRYAAREELASFAALVEEPPAESGSTGVELIVEPGEFAASDALPRCPGPFGGTTFLVLPEGLSEETAAAWREPERRRARVVGESELAEALEEHAASGLRNVLIVPAAFHAGAERMRELRRVARPFEDRLTLHWSPGLGGSK